MKMLQVVDVESVPDVSLVCEIVSEEAGGYLVAVMTARAQSVIFGASSGYPELRFLPMGDYDRFVTECEEGGLYLSIA